MHAAIAAVALKSVKAEATHKILLNGTNCPGAMCSLGVAPVTAGASSAVLVKALWARGGVASGRRYSCAAYSCA